MHTPSSTFTEPIALNTSTEARHVKRLLIVKTSSMGDVVHALPAVSDLLVAYPHLHVEWLVEKAFADIPQLHPGVKRVWPMAWRKWRKTLWRADTRQAIAMLRRDLRATPFDVVLDLQGLVKSALWARQARGPVCGYDRASAREPLAAWLYARHASVSRSLHAVDRNRRLTAAHGGYALPTTPPNFGIQAPKDAAWQATVTGARGTAALIIGGSRPASMWPDAHWVALAQRLQAQGLTPIPVWGTPTEKARAEQLLVACGVQPQHALPPFLSVRDTAAVLGRAAVVVGHDTGFTHLAAALGCTTVGINIDHAPALTGVTGPGRVVRLGGGGGEDGEGRMPDVAAVWRALALDGGGG
jgi:heptosyltransferase I